MINDLCNLIAEDDILPLLDTSDPVILSFRFRHIIQIEVDVDDVVIRMFMPTILLGAVLYLFPDVDTMEYTHDLETLSSFCDYQCDGRNIRQFIPT